MVCSYIIVNQISIKTASNKYFSQYANQISVMGSEGCYFKFKNRKIGYNTKEDYIRKYKWRVILYRKRQQLNDTIEKIKGKSTNKSCTFLLTPNLHNLPDSLKTSLIILEQWAAKNSPKQEKDDSEVSWKGDETTPNVVRSEEILITL